MNTAREPLRIERPNFAELPSTESLVRLAQDNEWLLIQVPTSVIVVGGRRSDPTLEVRGRLMSEIATHLPRHAVWDSGFLPDDVSLPAARRNAEGTTLTGFARVSIRRVITDQAIEAHLDLLLSAATEYGSLTNSLMARLANQLGVSLSEFSANELWHPHEQRGRLRKEVAVSMTEEWSYFFHGVDCLFESKVTGVTVEARLGFGAEGEHNFGVLDPWFFLQFLNTSSKVNAEYSLLLELLRDWRENALRAFEYMEQRGLLRSVSSAHDIGRGWVVAGTPLAL